MEHLSICLRATLIPILAFTIMSLAACTQAPSTGLVKPDDWLMVPPAKIDPLPDKASMKELYDRYIRLRQKYGRESDKVRGLQAYAKTVSK